MKERSLRQAFIKRFKIPKNETERLLCLISATDNAIGKEGTSIDLLFTDQAKKLRKELRTLRKK